MDSWRRDIIAALSDGEYHPAGKVYNAIEAEIPAYCATRLVARRRKENVVHLSDLDRGRWLYFTQFLSQIGVEATGRGHHSSIHANSLIKLSPHGRCSKCRGPVFRRTMYNKLLFCLACGTSVVPLPVEAKQKREMDIFELLRFVYQEQRIVDGSFMSIHGDALIVHHVINQIKPPEFVDMLKWMGLSGYRPVLPVLKPPPKVEEMKRRGIWRSVLRRVSRRPARMPLADLEAQQAEVEIWAGRMAAIERLIQQLRLAPELLTIELKELKPISPQGARMDETQTSSEAMSHG